MEALKFLKASLFCSFSPSLFLLSSMRILKILKTDGRAVLEEGW